MSIDTALEQYFDAWNSHEPEQVAAALTDGGTYEDPTTGGPLSGDALTASVAGVLAGFPDVHFEIDSVATNGDTASRAVAHARHEHRSAAGWPRHRRIARPPRRRLLHLRRRGRPGELGGRLLRHRDHARPARPAGPHHAGRHGTGDQVRVRAARRLGPRHGARRVHGHLDRDRRRAPPAPDREDHRDRHGAARRRGRLPRRLPGLHRTTQVHVHRMDDARSGARRRSAATRTPRR